jgi:hypothetical protein
MSGVDDLKVLFVVTAFMFQIVLVVHFVLRKWSFDFSLRYGWIVYALGVPAAAASVLLLLGDETWPLWLGGFIYLVWGGYGYWVEYVRRIQWRNPIHWLVFGPYVFLYLATTMFYWWPLALINRSLWYVYAVLFIVSTILNVTSHRGSL